MAKPESTESSPVTHQDIPQMKGGLQLGESTLFSHTDLEDRANFQTKLELVARRTKDAATESLNLTLYDAAIPTLHPTDLTRVLELELSGKNVSGEDFLKAAKEFIDGTENIGGESAWDGSYGVEVAPTVRETRGDDERYFNQRPPLDIEAVLQLQGKYDPNISPRIWIGAGIDAFREFELIRDESGDSEVQVRVSTNEFEDKEKLSQDIQRFFAHFNSGVVEDSLSEMLTQVQAV